MPSSSLSRLNSVSSTVWFHGVDYERDKFKARQQLQRTEAWLGEAARQCSMGGGAAACYGTIYATAVMGLIVERSPIAKPDDLPETLSLDLSRFQRARIEFVCLADRAAVFALASGVVAVLDSKTVNAKSKHQVGNICNHCLLAFFFF